MTAIELIELAQEKIRNAAVSSDWWVDNIGNLHEAIKYLNEAKILIGEHQTGLSVKNEESLKTT